MKMDKNKFDSDFDLEKELGFDPREFLGEEPSGDLDLSEFDVDNLGIDLQDTGAAEDNYDDFDLSDLDLGEDFSAGDFSAEDPVSYAPEEPAGYAQQDPMDYDPEAPMDFSDGDSADYGTADPMDYDAGLEDDFPMDDQENFLDREEFHGNYESSGEEDEFIRPASRTRQPEEFDDEDLDPDAPAWDGGAGEDYDPDMDPDMDPDLDPDMDPDADPDLDPDMDPDADPDQDPGEGRSHRRERPKKEHKPKKVRVKPPKPEGPSLFTKFAALYFAPLVAEASGKGEAYDPEHPRRRKRSKSRIFKEVYLPPLILGVAVILVLTCVVGSLSHAFQRKKINDEFAAQESIAVQNQQDLQKQEYNSIMQQADIMAKGYDYEGAIKLIESYSGIAEAPQEMLAKKAEYAQAQSGMVEFKDPSIIPNLSFHVLIAEPSQAFSDKEYGGLYNKNFVTVDEFQKILDSLYQSGHVLVDFDSFLDRQVGVDGRESFFVQPIMLPAGKKPVMITETMVNYFNYMIDNDEDGPDGFASKLVVDGNGDIKAELVDANGQSKVGNYDLVPILEDFIKAHPDFSYRGARATLAVTGSEGIFGYRINTEHISDPALGQAYHDEQVAGAKVLVQALRDKGYTLASYTYSNKDYSQRSVKEISKDMQDWKSQVTPVMGDVDVMVFARDSDINDYTGNKYSTLADNGFKIFVGKGDKPSAEVNQTYVHQKRLIVSGHSIQWKSDQFTGMFDAAAIKNPTRGDVPTD